MKKFNQFINEGIKIDGLEYPISERSFEYMKHSGYSNFAYSNNNTENWNDKKHIRLYNHITKQHFYLERVWPKIGDNNLIFVDFPRTDAPPESWSQHATQYAKVRSWGQSRENYHGDFIRFKIIEINKNDYCKVDDGYNEQTSGWYTRDSFYKINKIY